MAKLEISMLKLRFFILIFFISLLLYGAPSLSNSNALIPLKVLFGIRKS